MQVIVSYWHLADSRLLSRVGWAQLKLLPSMCWKKEGPLRAQLPVSTSVVGRYDIVIGGEVGIDRLVTDLEDAPDAAADRHSPAIILKISRRVGSYPHRLRVHLDPFECLVRDLFPTRLGDQPMVTIRKFMDVRSARRTRVFAVHCFDH